MMKQVEVFVDDREKNDLLLASLQTYSQLIVTVKHLSLGDYQFGEQMIFERKTIEDFARSLLDGRLFKQACRLLNSPLQAVLLLEGDWKEFSIFNIRREALEGAMIMLNVTLGIPVIYSQHAQDSARLMLYASEQAVAKSSAIVRYGRRPKGKRRLQLHILQGLPGIGPHRAMQLLEKFGSVQAVINAALDELQTVDGIGQKTAEHIHWAIKPTPDQHTLISV